MTDARLRQLDRLAGWAAVVLVGVPFLVNAVVSLGLEWHPASDRAVIVTRVADVFGGDRPLVGAYSRFGFNHPGPLGTYLLAPAFEAVGPAGVLATAAAINGVAAVAAVALVRRRAGALAAVASAIAVLAVTRALGAVLLRDPWNPWLPVVPFALVLVAAWAMATGSRWALPVALGAGSFVVQAHVGAAPVVAAVGAFGVVVLAVRAARHRFDRSVAGCETAGPRGDGEPDDPAAGGGSTSRPGWWRSALLVAATVVVVVVAWGPPVREQVAAPPGEGNLSRLVAHFGAGGREVEGVGASVAAAGRQVSPVGPWLTGDEPADPFTGDVEPGWPPMVALFLAAVVAATVVAVRRHRRLDPSAALAATVLVAASAGLVAVARIDDGLYPYLIRWWWWIAAFGWLAVVWVAIGSVAARLAAPVARGMRGVLLGIGTVALVGLVVVAAGQATTRRVPDDQESRALAAFAGPALAAVPGDAPVAVDWSGQDVGALEAGLIPILEGAGRPVTRPPDQAYIWGPTRTGRGGAAADRRLVTMSGPGATDADRQRAAGLEQLAAYDTLEPGERAEQRRLQAELDDAAARARARGEVVGFVIDPVALGLDPDRFARLVDLNRRGWEAGLYRPVDPGR